MALAIAAGLFLCVAGLITAFGYRRYVAPGGVYESLKPAASALPADAPANPRFYTVTQFAEQVAQRVPLSSKQASRYQRKLLACGYRARNAVQVFWGLKLLLAAALAAPVLALQLRVHLQPAPRLLLIAAAAAAGYLLPDYGLSRRVRQRQNRLRKALPDALDLMVVCAQSGLALDRSLRTVTQFLTLRHPDLSDEFGLVRAEITAVIRRSEALENFADRTEEPEIRKFVGVLLQADRFGTSLGEALRTHADYLRVRRRLEAEERASKVGVKLIFPIFFCMLPTILLVAAGPAVLEIARNLGPALTGK
jgi:tight adherence protein C